MMRAILLLPLLFAAGAAQSAPRATFGITGGTLGIGPEAGVRLNDHIGARVNATFLSFSHGFDSDDLDYDGRARLRSTGAMIDAYPFGGGFRISGGARLNSNRARVRAMPTRSTTVGGTTYTPAMIGTIDGRGTVRDVAPALTLGWAGRNRTGFVAGIEAGALFQGRVRVSPLTSSTGLVSAADLERERRDLQDDVDDYRVYPLLQLTLGYRF